MRSSNRQLSHYLLQLLLQLRSLPAAASCTPQLLLLLLLLLLQDFAEL
jgi:hypothetical protein